MLSCRLFADYHTKMKSHKQLVSELESGMTTHLEVKKQLEIIQTLQAESKIPGADFTKMVLT